MTSHGSRHERQLAGQVAVVTGGGRGIGRAVAQGLAAQGASVAVLARSEHELADVVKHITTAGDQALALLTDVTEVQVIPEVMAAVEHQLEPIDLLVNNAGIITPLGPAWEVEPGAWWRALR